MSRPKRLYYHKIDEMIWPVVAHNIPHAKKLLWEDSIYSIADGCDNQYVNLKCKWAKEYDVSDQPIGMLDMIVGLRLGVLTYVLDTECPECGSSRYLEYNSFLDAVCCSDCEDKLLEEAKNESEDMSS